jgi:CDP-diacylglycerol--glycerol-3-phosphate 3-phosphatidyltransferase
MPRSDDTDRPRSDPDDRRARVRDMPAPRDNPSIAAPFLRRVFSWPFKAVLAGVYRAGFKPWHLTVMALAMNVLVGWLLVRGLRLLPGVLLFPAGVLDLLDGAVARLRGEESRFGAFLDSGLDRVSDAILFGCLFWSLAEQGQELAAALALATLGVSLGVSYVRAAAEARGVKLGEGLFQRLERYVALMVALIIPGAMVPALVVLLALGCVTLIQRIWGGGVALLAVHAEDA